MEQVVVGGCWCGAWWVVWRWCGVVGVCLLINNIMSQLKEDQLSQYQQLQQLKQRVHVSSNRLLELTYNDHKYIEKLITYNAEAKKLILDDYIQEALVYLSEAEKILEYGASCGKVIDRNLIITTLHNEACCYYKDSDLNTAAKYLDGVIFNITSNLHSLSSSPALSAVLDNQKGSKNNQFLYASIQKKIQLVQYYLKFCTINSQAKKREAALEAGSKVLRICTSLFQDIVIDNPKLIACDDNNGESELGDLKALLKCIQVFKQQLRLSQLQSYIKYTRYYVRKWGENKVVKKISFGLEKHVNNYSISQVIDMLPIQYNADDSQNNQHSLNTRLIMRQILHFSMGYFTLSTEYRLIAQTLYKNPEDRLQSQEFIKSNIYHLLSILFLAFNLNCDLLFMKQIVSSYEHHFKTSLTLTDNNEEPQLEEKCRSLLFNAVQPKAKVSHNVLFEKISKLKLKEKEVKKKVHTEYEDSYTYDNVGKKAVQGKKVLKNKRSISKKGTNGLSSAHNILKTVNQTIMEDSKVYNLSKDRSISKDKQTFGLKQRSKSKQVFNLSKELKVPKDPIKIQQKGKRGHDQYQLGNTKLQTRKRVNSLSHLSASLNQKHQSRPKMLLEDQKLKDRKAAKKMEAASKKKKKSKQQGGNKHYYL